MRSRRLLVGAIIVTISAALAGIGLAYPASATPADHASIETPARPELAPVIPGHGLMMPLQEFRTSRYAGWYYTLNPAEAALAVRKFKFVRQGIVGFMRVRADSDTVPVHRLRVRVGEPSYLLSIWPDEITDRRYVDEGVIGHVYSSPKPGLVRLIRLSNNTQWRVALETWANAQKAAGYIVDGTLGWVRP